MIATVLAATFELRADSLSLLRQCSVKYSVEDPFCMLWRSF